MREIALGNWAAFAESGFATRSTNNNPVSFEFTENSIFFSSAAGAVNANSCFPPDIGHVVECSMPTSKLAKGFLSNMIDLNSFGSDLKINTTWAGSAATGGI